MVVKQKGKMIKKKEKVEISKAGQVNGVKKTEEKG